MAILLVQSVSVTVGGVNNTTLAFGLDLTGGNLIVACQQHYMPVDAAISTPTDSIGHTYFAAGAQQLMDFVTDGARLGTYSVENCGGGADIVTFDIAGTATNGSLACVIAEFSGIAIGGGALDKTAATENVPGSTAVASPATATTVQANELLWGAMMYDGGGATMDETTPGGFSLVQEIEAAPINCEYKVVSATGAYQSLWTLSASRRWMCHIATFKDADAGGGGAAPFVPRRRQGRPFPFKPGASRQFS